MTRREYYLCTVVRFLPAFVFSFIMLITHVKFWWLFLLLGVYLESAWLSGILVTWFTMGHTAYRIADQAVRDLNETPEANKVQVTEGIHRKFPPRHFYATAIASRNEPIVMYRGWKLVDMNPITDPRKSSTTSLACRRYWR